MSLLFIDTNIFLDFYSTSNKKGAVSDIINKFKALSNNIILPEQVIDEFRRRRDSFIDAEINKIVHNNTILITNNTSISDKYNTYMKIRAELNDFLREIKDDPKKDPIYTTVDELYRSAKKTPKRTPEIIEKASLRYLLGNPPSSGGNSHGDEIIWESLLSECDNDLVVLSKDKTGYLNSSSFLVQEYYEKTKKKLSICLNIKDALKLMNVSVSDEIEEYDKVVSHPMKTQTFIITSSNMYEPASSNFYQEFPSTCIRISDPSNYGQRPDPNRYIETALLKDDSEEKDNKS